MKTILFLGTSLFAAKYLPKAAEAMGFKPIFLLKINDYSGMPKKAIETYEHYEADVNSLEDILRAIRENNFMEDVVAITSLLDETLQNACAIAEQFNIAGPDPALVQLSDKTIVRKIIPEFSPPSLEIKLDDAPEEQLKYFLNTHAAYQEFVLKPGISSGAVGISIVDRTITIEQIKELIYDSPLDNAEHQHWVLQPRILGSLYSAEGYVKNGQVYYLGFSKRVRKNLTEMANEFPVDNDLSANIKQSCQDAIKALVDRSDYKNGYFHCEFIIHSGEEIFLIDANMGRIAGGGGVQQLALSYNINSLEIYKHLINLSVFNEKYSDTFSYGDRNQEKTLLICYCLEKPAMVLNVESPAEMTCSHIQIADNGKTMPGFGTSDSAWVGFLTGFKEKVLEEIQNITINTNNGSVPPYYTVVE